MLLKSKMRQTVLTTRLYKTEQFTLNSQQRYDSMLAIANDKAQVPSLSLITSSREFFNRLKSYMVHGTQLSELS